MGVTLFFLEKNLTTFFVIASESDDLFSCRLLTSPIFPRPLSSVLSKFSHKKLILGRVSPPGGFHPGRSSPFPSLTPLEYVEITLRRMVCGFVVIVFL